MCAVLFDHIVRSWFFLFMVVFIYHGVSYSHCSSSVLSNLFLSQSHMSSYFQEYLCLRYRCNSESSMLKQWKISYIAANCMHTNIHSIELFTWRFKWAHQLTFLVTWHGYCWITNCLSDQMSSRESEHSTLVVAWFVSDLTGKSVFAKQSPWVWESLWRLCWLDDAWLNLNHIYCFEMVQRVGFNLV